MSPRLLVSFLRFAHLEKPRLRPGFVNLHTSSSLGDEVRIVNGLPHIEVTLPSRNEKCLFVLRPISQTVGDFLNMLKVEDPGIDRVFVKRPDGSRVASATSIQNLMMREFELNINDNNIKMSPPPLDPDQEKAEKISSVRTLICHLYEALNVQELQIAKEQHIIRRLEDLRAEIRPLEEQHQEILRHAEKKTRLLEWALLFYMSLQTGVLARLTWWEYSWDIIEPITYFVTYSGGMIGMAYFILTKNDFNYPQMRDRQSLILHHKKAKKHRWDVERYNKLKGEIFGLERELKKLRGQEDGSLV